MKIKDIAKLAGVSAATVSYALNDSGRVSPQVKQRILEIAAANNYMPNLIAKSLRSNRTYTIGVLVEDIKVLATSRIINGIQKYAESHGYQILLSDLGLWEKIDCRYDEALLFKDKIQSALSVFKSLQADGIIYIGMHDRNVTGLLETDKPIVYTYCYTENKTDYMVTYSNDIAYDVTNYLIDIGHKKIGLISGPINSTPSHKRLLGYQTALMERGIELNLKYISVGNWEYEFGYKACEEFMHMQKEERPTAIFAMNDLMAIGAIEAAGKLGFSVPKDLSVIGFDDTEIGRYYHPKLTTVALPLQEIGSIAAEIIDKLSSGEAVDIQEQILPCTMIKRETVREV